MQNGEESGNSGESPTRSDLIIPTLVFPKPIKNGKVNENLPYHWRPGGAGSSWDQPERQELPYPWRFVPPNCAWHPNLGVHVIHSIKPDGKLFEDSDFSSFDPEMIRQYIERERVDKPEQVRTTETPEGGKWYFLTYTQGPEFDLDAETLIGVIKRLDTVKDKTAQILHYEGCLEHHESGKLHAHVIVQLSNSPAGGVKKFFEGRYTLKKMKIGNIQVKSVNFRTNPNSLEDMRKYCAKENFRKIEK